MYLGAACSRGGTDMSVIKLRHRDNDEEVRFENIAIFKQEPEDGNKSD